VSRMCAEQGEDKSVGLGGRVWGLHEGGPGGRRPTGGQWKVPFTSAGKKEKPAQGKGKDPYRIKAPRVGDVNRIKGRLKGEQPAGMVRSKNSC